MEAVREIVRHQVAERPVAVEDAQHRPPAALVRKGRILVALGAGDGVAPGARERGPGGGDGVGHGRRWVRLCRRRVEARHRKTPLNAPPGRLRGAVHRRGPVRPLFEALGKCKANRRRKRGRRGRLCGRAGGAWETGKRQWVAYVTSRCTERVPCRRRTRLAVPLETRGPQRRRLRRRTAHGLVCCTLRRASCPEGATVRARLSGTARAAAARTR